jgi:hypothetical protein
MGSAKITDVSLERLEENRNQVYEPDKIGNRTR